MLFVGCSSLPDGEPADVAYQYLEYIKDKKFDLAYGMLSDANKTTVTSQDFTNYLSTIASFETINMFSCSSSEIKSITKIDNIEFKHSTDIKVNMKIVEKLSKAETDKTQIITIVNESEVWKVYLKTFDAKAATHKIIEDAAKGSDPSEVAKNYVQYYSDKNYDAAYSLLCNDNKQTTTLDELTYNIILRNEVERLVDVKVSNKGEIIRKELNGITYDFVATVTVTSKYIDYSNNSKEVSDTYERTLIFEPDGWKVFRETPMTESISYNLQQIGWMYMTGNGKEKNYNESLTYLNKAIEYDRTNAAAYYCLAYVYIEKKENSDCLENAIKCVENAGDDNVTKSNGYNIMGNAYWNMGDTKKAKECYKKALEANPNNQYAKENLGL